MSCPHAQEKSGQVDAYIRMTLYDPSTGNTEAFRTNTQINDPSPRFNQKFDFIDVPAISHFTATVFDKSGLIESRLTMTPWKQARRVWRASNTCGARSLAVTSHLPTMLWSAQDIANIPSLQRGGSSFPRALHSIVSSQCIPIARRRQGLRSAFLMRVQKGDTELGNLRLNVEEVARNKTMKDLWPLQNANKGDIELTLSFQPVIFEEDEAVRARCISQICA